MLRRTRFGKRPGLTPCGQNRSSVRHAIVSAPVFALAVIASVSLSTSLQISGANRSESISQLPDASYLARSPRALVISPHPDDESLGCGGLISNICRNGGSVRVVFLTSGDGFRVAVERENRKLKVGPEQYTSFGHLRQVEARLASYRLGLKREDITFLGFPDRGLVTLWTSNWMTPFTSIYTRASRCPYNGVYRPGEIYTGQAVMRDLVEIISTYRPSDLFVTHPLDDHPDHYAAFAFVTAALEEVRERDRRLANGIHLHTYLVHRGPWPTPRDNPEDRYMTPPAAIAATDTRWKVLRLEQEDIEAKAHAINSYKSQTAIMGSFLRSFARKNELFGDLAPQKVALVRDGAIRVDGDPRDWKRIAPQIEDPHSDTVPRALKEGLDIRRMWMAKDSRNLYLRVDTVKPLPLGASLNILVRTTDGTVSRAVRVVFNAPSRVHPRGTPYKRRGNVFEAAVRLKDVGPADEIWAGASTYYLKFNIDKTGYRPIFFPHSPALTSAR